LTKEILVCLKQAPRAWYEKINQFLLNLGFKPCEPDHVICLLHVNVEILVVPLYVDYLVIIRSDVYLIFGLKKQLANTFEMTDLGLLHFRLGFQVS
jgi:hypothetical protein